MFLNKKDSVIRADRDSVCMGDDCMPHCKELTINSKISIRELLAILADYVPSMKNVIWAVQSNSGLCGYIITDEQANASFEVYGEDTSIRNRGIKEVMCKYYYPSKFSWIDGKSGERVDKYPECETFLEKVKRDNEEDD